MLSVGRAAAAEALGTGILATTVVGSGLMAVSVLGLSTGLALLVNAVATAAMLSVLIVALESISGAHLNPVVTLVAMVRGRLTALLGCLYVLAQCSGAVAGVVMAHAMFSVPLLQIASSPRTGIGLMCGELVATACLLLVILLTEAARPKAVAATVALFIGSAYWFTSSTSFANPALTVARALSDTFVGISPANVPAFIVAQLVGGGVGAALGLWLTSPLDAVSANSK